MKNPFFFKKSLEVVQFALNHQTTIYVPVQIGFHEQSRKISIFREKAKKHLFG